MFVPKGRPESAIGELWFVFFDGESGEHTVMKEELPIAQCAFATTSFDVRIGDAVLSPGRLIGGGSSEGIRCEWDLSYSSSHDPVFLQSRRAYSLPFPKAKSLIAHPLAVFSGVLNVGDRVVQVQDWVGSQNHNWGSAHTDRYAFAQVAGFDEEPDSFLEIATAQVRVGPLRTPWATMMVLRARGREYDMSSLIRAVRNEGKYSFFEWDFVTENDQARITGRITAPRDAFVGLVYYNPSGGIKHCINTKIGSCELEVNDKTDGHSFRLSTSHRALFEILTDERRHGVGIRA
ncbi:hypothetical protein [Rhodococcus tibetensis]|uniref:Uncharacterized protein n=1 Tax=Rhodococcus tibetensis TaxID=2965064 RepID=A0ABT1Q9M2_9NOCA|nr:hypothetical protein [Rhodococcus sp. FXJ9.536]MCQ4118936.1 hypothetical protein [Rhodococcus sp. FXJ9.536]